MKHKKVKSNGIHCGQRNRTGGKRTHRSAASKIQLAYERLWRRIVFS